MSGLQEELLIAVHGIWNRRWLALAVAWGVCVLGWLGVAMIPNSYQSTAKVFVQARSILPGQLGITPNEQQQSLDAVRQTLTSNANLEKVVKGTDLRQSVASDRDLAGKVAGLRLGIKVVSDLNNVISISATSADTSLSDGANAKIAQQVTQKLVDIFQEENVLGDRDETRQSLAFLDAQVAARGRQLQAADEKRVEFAQKYMGLLPGVGSIADRMNAARNEISQIDSSLIAAQSALAAANGQLAGTPATIAATGTGAPTALGQAQSELAAARARGWTDSHPDVVALQRQIASLRAQGGAAAASGTPNPVYVSARSMQAERAAAVAGYQARKGQLQSELNGMIARQTDEPGVAAEQERLDREYNALKTQYDKLLSDREDVRLRGDAQSETDTVKFRVIEPPSFSRVPAAPNRPLLLAGVLVAGLGAGVAAAFAMTQLRAGYATAGRLEKAAGIPVIGSITEIVTTAEVARRQQRLRWFAGGSGGLVGLCLLLVAAEFVQRSMT